MRDAGAEEEVQEQIDEVLKQDHLALFRDILGNPFASASVDSSWLSWHNGTIQRLAQAIYEDRELPSGHLDIKRLAVLADALEDAGCADQVILGHLRSAGRHVRGCFVIDALTGRS